MKRSYPDQPEIDSITMANCLMLLSQRSQTVSFPSIEAMKSGTIINSPNRVFECKTCNRQFPSFQALGGHRASHKKPRLIGGSDSSETSSSSPAKPKTHECSICGVEFAIGQALGGHMRRHRAAINDQNLLESDKIVKKSNTRRVLCLDLNLTPYENDLELFKIGKISTPIYG